MRVLTASAWMPAGPEVKRDGLGLGGHVHGDDDGRGAARGGADVGEDVLVVGVEHDDAAVAEGGEVFAHRDEVLVPVVETGGVGGFGLDVDGFVAGWDGQPGVWVGGEAGLRAGGPLHGGALAVAALFLGPAGDADGIFYVFLAGGIGGGHADICAVVGEGGGFAGEEDGGDDLRDFDVVGAVAEARDGAWVVVIIEDDEGL